MKDTWLKFGCFLTGYNYTILKGCSEASAKDVKKYTSALLIVMILWGFIGYSFAQRYLHASNIVSVITAVIWIIIIVQVERQIILGLGRNRLLGVSRLILGLVMACIGSLIVDQIIFKDDIEKAQLGNLEMEVNNLLPLRTAQLNFQKAQLQNRFDSTSSVLYQFQNEVGNNPYKIIHIKETERKYDTAKGKWVASREVIKPQTMINPKANFIPGLNKQLDMLSTQVIQTDSSINNARAELYNEIKKKKGFLDELIVLKSILLKNDAALIVWSLMFLFFLIIELLVIIAKFGGRATDYDRVILHQMDLKFSLLDKLAEKEYEKTSSIN